MDFITNEFTFKSASGLCDIYAQSAAPSDFANVKGVIQITHGMAEHSNRYARFAMELCKNGYAVYICDLLGHVPPHVLLNVEEYRLDCVFDRVEDIEAGLEVALGDGHAHHAAGDEAGQLVDRIEHGLYRLFRFHVGA